MMKPESELDIEKFRYQTADINFDWIVRSQPCLISFDCLKCYNFMIATNTTAYTCVTQNEQNE